MSLTLYTYFRSSAAFRVRIALNVKGLEYQSVAINLKPGVDAQFDPDYLALNPQGRVPLLIDGERVISQSPAIIEYLEEAYPARALLPADLSLRTKARQLSAIIACDVHPLNNLAVLQALKAAGLTQAQVDAWYSDWIQRGFSAFEHLLSGETRFCLGDELSLADVFLVPQVWNAHRFQVDLSVFNSINRIYQQCLQVPAVKAALPEYQADNPDAIAR